MIMHLGKKKIREEHLIDGTVLESTAAEKDIGVIIQDNLKPPPHCAKTAAKANEVLGQLSRAVLQGLQHLHQALPIIEYCIQAVGPHAAGDKRCLEKVQMRTVNIVKTLAGAPTLRNWTS